MGKKRSYPTLFPTAIPHLILILGKMMLYFYLLPRLVFKHWARLVKIQLLYPIILLNQPYSRCFITQHYIENIRLGDILHEVDRQDEIDIGSCVIPDKTGCLGIQEIDRYLFVIDYTKYIKDKLRIETDTKFFSF